MSLNAPSLFPPKSANQRQSTLYLEVFVTCKFRPIILNAMAGSRAHHFLPISYLNGFIDPEILRRQKRRVVWVYERGRGVRKSTPENEAHQRDFYLHESGSIEGALAEMESVVAPILADLREHPRPPTAAESGELAHYIALTFYRGPTGRQHIDQMASSVMKEISMEMAKDEANFKKTCEETAREHDLNIRADELREWVLKGEFDVQQKSPGCRVRWWRGSGLRMMPTFPPPPPSFRTAGFPQYGWKVGLSGSAFPHVAQVKPAPGIPCTTCRFASALRALRCLILRSALCRNSEFGGALPCEELSPLPKRPSLRSGLYCPSPSSLNRPHPSHSQAHPDFPAWRVIRDAFAVLVRLGDPRVVPCFRCSSFSTCRPLRPRGVRWLYALSSFANDAGLHRDCSGSALPSFPSSASDGMSLSRLPWFAVRYGLSSCLPPWRIRPGISPDRQRLLLPSFRSSRSPFSSSGMTTVATEQAPPTGLSPAGTTASIAARNPMLDEFHKPFVGKPMVGRDESCD
jgi:Protein of unknown function (DUF4238)